MKQRIENYSQIIDSTRLSARAHGRPCIVIVWLNLQKFVSKQINSLRNSYLGYAVFKQWCVSHVEQGEPKVGGVVRLKPLTQTHTNHTTTSIPIVYHISKSYFLARGFVTQVTNAKSPKTVHDTRKYKDIQQYTYILTILKNEQKQSKKAG